LVTVKNYIIRFRAEGPEIPRKQAQFRRISGMIISGMIIPEMIIPDILTADR